jgi:hypothetical protein
MKKLAILLGLVSLLFSAGSTQKDVYLDYTNKVINYEFNLNNISKVKNPFYSVPVYVPGVTSTVQNSQVKKRVQITLISIFGKKAYIKVDEYLGEQLTSTSKKWIGINDKIYDCKLVKITDTDAAFKCANKTLNKTINQKIPMLRDGK